MTFKSKWFARWLSVPLLCLSLGASAQSIRDLHRPGSDRDRHHHKYDMPEGGSAFGYLLLAGLVCGGAVILRRRQIERGKSVA